MSARRTVLIAAAMQALIEANNKGIKVFVEPPAPVKDKRKRKDRRAAARKAAKAQPDQPSQEVEK